MGFMTPVIVKHHSLHRDHSFIHCLSHITIFIMESKKRLGIIIKVIQETKDRSVSRVNYCLNYLT